MTIAAKKSVIVISVLLSKDVEVAKATAGPVQNVSADVRSRFSQDQEPLSGDTSRSVASAAAAEPSFPYETYAIIAMVAAGHSNIVPTF